MPTSRDTTEAVTIRPLDQELWVAEHGLRAGVIELGRRMTVVRLADGALWLHSVCRLTPSVRSWLDGLGTVRYVVSPSRTHSRWMEDYREAYPEALLIGAPGLSEKRPDLAFDRTLRDTPEPEWAGWLDQVAFPFRGEYREVVFLHRPTATLILTDLCFNIPPGRGLPTTVGAWILGYYRRLAVSRLLRIAIENRAAARSALDRILAWHFDRVIVGHGDIVESGGQAAVRRAFAWLRRE